MRIASRILLLYCWLIAAACFRCPKGAIAVPVPVRSPEPRLPAASDRLKILTWNIWMMPEFIFQSPRNILRAKAIAGELLTFDFDILCLEKAFDSFARVAMTEVLRARYPYQYGPANSRFSLKINSGVWILSRIPLSVIQEIQFRDCAGIECASRKGAMLASGDFHGHEFRIVATHLEGEPGSAWTEQRQQVRDKQMEQIRDELLQRYDKPGVPVFIAGDFDTPHRGPSNPMQESAGYQFMLRTLGAVNGPEDHVTFDDNCAHNDLAMSNGGRTDELDYILMAPHGTNTTASWRREIIRHPRWDGSRSDLSYRYAVTASIAF
jgi:endonuclease/exonuclease/phosphatase family metal-dependent hydrolase